MRASSRAEPIAGVGKGGVEDGIQHLQNRLLYQTVYGHRNTQLALSSSRLRYLHSTHWLGLVGPVQQGSRQRHMILRKPVSQFVDSPPVHAGLSLVSAHPTVRTDEILRVAYLLH